MPRVFQWCINAMSVTKQRPDMWRVICEAFNFTSDVIQAIEDNSADAKLRCIDLIHFFVPSLSWCHFWMLLKIVLENLILT